MSGPVERSLWPIIDVFVLVAVRLYRDGIAAALGRDPRFSVVGSAGTLEGICRQLGLLARPPDVILIDLGLAEGAATTRLLRSEWSTTGIVALAVPEGDEEVILLAEAGVAGFVSREATLSEVLDAIEAAARDGVLTTPAVTAVLLRRVALLAGERTSGHGRHLTQRERQIVALVGHGLSNKEIGSALHIELPTVKNHVHNILEKLNVSRRGDALAAARARGEYWIEN